MVLRPEDIVKMQDRLFNHCRLQAQKKGNDYSGNAEDTFSNLRRVKDFGVTKNDMGTVLAELVKKCSRLANFSQPGFVSQVTEESAFDTISDLINYATYWQMFFEEDKARPILTKDDKPLDVEYVKIGKNSVVPRLTGAILKKSKENKYNCQNETDHVLYYQGADHGLSHIACRNCDKKWWNEGDEHN